MKRFGLNIYNDLDYKIWEVDHDIKRLALADSVLYIYNDANKSVSTIMNVDSFDVTFSLLCTCSKDSTVIYSFDLVPIMTSKLQLIKVVAGAKHFMAFDAFGRVFGVGSNLHGQLGICGMDASDWTLNQTLEGLKVIDVAAGDLHSLFLTESGIVFGCGNNDFGQIGLPLIGFEDIGQNIPKPVFESLDGSTMQIAAGARHSVILVDSKVYGSGWSKYNQLGEMIDQIRGFKRTFLHFTVTKVRADKWETVLD
jgi:alpha-tubulin suppressor-like RCC1 family protein